MKRVRLPRAVLSFLAAICFVGCGSEDVAPFECIDVRSEGLRVDVLYDEGPHREQVEWWYYTGHLISDAGNTYGFELTFFQSRVPLLSGRQAHFAVTDLQNGSFHFMIDPPFLLANGPYPAQEQGFSLSVPAGWTAEGRDGRDHLQASVDGYSLDLQLEALKSPLYPYGTGYREFPFGGYTYYYSRSRMNAAGTLTLAGVPVPVTGQAWFDHQWGDLWPVLWRGWDWFSLQLDSGEEIMLFVVRSREGTPVIDGSFVNRDCTTELIESTDLELQAEGFWVSPHSQRAYPSGWNLRLPKKGIVLLITPQLSDQEVYGIPPIGESYWEGMVSVSGKRGDASVSGNGYVELTMY